MQTLEFTKALKRIVEGLKIPELTALMAPWINPRTNAAPIGPNEKNQLAALLFESNAGYRRLSEETNTRRILESVGVGQFYEPSRLAAMLNAVTSAQNTQQIYNNWQNFAHFYSFSELVQSLARLERAASQLLEKEKIGNVNPSDGILELELVEYSDEVGISPRRLQVFALSVSNLHDHIARVLGIEGDKVTFKYFDSGSGLLVGIECGKAIIQALTGLLKDWWERIVYWRYENFDKKIGALSKSVAFADTVQQAVDKGTITAEVGENMKVRVFREVENLTRIGAIIPISENATIDRRQLLTEVRNTKLLTDGTSAQAEEPVAEPSTPKQE
jgi:hypothetical protein